MIDHIWCLFSIENNYDQPTNNLEAWWSYKPSLEQLSKFFELEFPCLNDEDTISMVHLWKGGEYIDYYGTTYRLQLVSEGKVQ